MTGSVTLVEPYARNIWSFKTGGLMAVVFQDRFHCTFASPPLSDYKVAFSVHTGLCILHVLRPITHTE